MNTPAQTYKWTSSGSFLIWEPDLKSLNRHRLVDSDRPATSFFKQGRLTVKGGMIYLEKNRHFVRLLTFVLCAPLWGGLAIGLAILAWLWFGHSLGSDAGVIIPIAGIVSASACAFLIGRVVRPIRRQYALAQVANVQLKHIQMTRNNVPTRGAGWVWTFVLSRRIQWIQTAASLIRSNLPTRNFAAS